MIGQDTAHTQKFNRSVSLLAWGLNEELLLKDFLDKAFDMLEAAVTDYEVVFVNDGSTDRTGEILAAYQAGEPRLKVINNPENVNVGISCRRAVQAASKEYLFWQTVDW
jgi:glycosyltransferase involved in cell wall biosynthesis